MNSVGATALGNFDNPFDIEIRLVGSRRTYVVSLVSLADVQCRTIYV
jgi:hypothetical protein